MWEQYPRQQYEHLLGGRISNAEQVEKLEAHVVKARATNKALPPGLRAHLGMLHLEAGNPDRARELWLAEKTAFPESSPYVDGLLKRLDKAATN